jgi:tRNA(Arg) A34 adenosine deaminase TadA
MDRAPAEPTIDDVDRAMMERCIALALRAADLGEYPYAAVICRHGKVVCEAINTVRHDRDVSHHAEVVAISEGLRRLNRASLEDCTIYANGEPCALCCCARPTSAVLCLACPRHSQADSRAGTFLQIPSCRTGT